MKTLVKRFIYLIAALLIMQCTPKEKTVSFVDPALYTWGTPDHITIEQGNFHSAKLLDSLNNLLVGDTLMPILIDGSKMIIEQLQPLQMEMKVINGVEDFYITKTGFKKDTFEYEVKKYIGKTFLLLISKNASSHAYQLKDPDVELPETNHISFPEYKIGGYAPGERINREDIEVLSSDQFGLQFTEEAILLDNENIYLKIRGKEFIEEMRWFNIEDAEANRIIDQLNNLFSEAPVSEYLEEDSDNTENIIGNYYWTENEVNVLLSRVTEFGELDVTWTLTYTNIIVSNILNNYLEEAPESI